MELIQTYKYKSKGTLKNLQAEFQRYLDTFARRTEEAFHTIKRQQTSYGENSLPLTEYSNETTSGVPYTSDTAQQSEVNTQERGEQNRYSVVYLRMDRYQHVGCHDLEQAQAALDKLLRDPERIAVGIYDSRTELFQWEPFTQQEYDMSPIKEQGKRAEEIVTIAQALRRRDSGWMPGDFQVPGFFS